MMPSPWKSKGEPVADREYLAHLSFLPLRSIWKLPTFLRMTSQVNAQLEGAAGLLGSATKAHVFSLHFFTLSVWEDNAALLRFAREKPHGGIMRALKGHMGQTVFLRWSIRGAEVPPRWEDALERFAQRKAK